ncbi:hypothetical protein [Paracoccus denitrificans]|uniref:hypothetical protein n=1 Tax=Paracoccus denitrificans TaxID=266 RepID=UPI00336519EA
MSRFRIRDILLVSTLIGSLPCSLAGQEAQLRPGDRIKWGNREACVISFREAGEKELQRLRKETPWKPSDTVTAFYLTGGVLFHLGVMTGLRFGGAVVKGPWKILFSPEFGIFKEILTPTPVETDLKDAAGFTPAQRLAIDFFVPQLGAAIDAAGWVKTEQTRLRNEYNHHMDTIATLEHVMKDIGESHTALIDCATGELLDESVIEGTDDAIPAETPARSPTRVHNCVGCHYGSGAVAGSSFDNGFNREGFGSAGADKGHGGEALGGDTGRSSTGQGGSREISRECGALGCVTVDSSEVEVR